MSGDQISLTVDSAITAMLALADEAASQPREVTALRSNGMYLGAIVKGAAFIIGYGQDGEELVRIADVQPADDVCCKVRLAGTTFWEAEFDFRRRATPIHDTAPTDQAQRGGEVERLREALRPFANLAHYMAGKHQTVVGWNHDRVTYDDFRNAAAALAQSGKGVE